MLDWLIEQYRKQFPDLTIDDVVVMAERDWAEYVKDMEDGVWK